jgi:hypothetical protein
MPTPMDRAMQSRNLFLGEQDVEPGLHRAEVANAPLGFAGLVGLAGLWNIWNGEVFPSEPDPTGGKSANITALGWLVRTPCETLS